MQVSGENEVIADAARLLPDPRVMRAEHTNITRWLCRKVRTEHGNHTGTVLEMEAAIVNPNSATLQDRVAYSAGADASVVVSTNCKYRRQSDKLLDQRSQAPQFAHLIHQIASEEHCVRLAAAHGNNELSRQAKGPAPAQMDIADVQQTTGVGM